MTHAVSASLVALMMTIAPATSQALTTVESKFAVNETGNRLADELEKRGIRVVARIDHAAGAKSAGLDMPPTEVIMFGNPRLGTPLMLAQPGVAIELPMKMLIWQDKSGKVMVGFTSPWDIKARYQISGQDEILSKMTEALSGLANAASSR